jgi:predicted dehydrogenase
MKVGLIGCGGIAPLHIRVYKNLKNVEVVGLCDLNQERAKTLANRFKVERTYKDYFEMLEKEKLDLVDICTPVTTHTRIACDAAKAVPSILMEKPMALNVAQCDEIINEINKRGTKLCIGHSQIFSPRIQEAKSIVDSGGFDLNCFTTVQKESFEILKKYDLAPPWNVSPEQKGIIWEVCCHLAYLQLYFLPNIEEVYAVGGKFKYPVYDDFAVVLRTSDKRFGVIELSWLSRETETVYEWRGTSGRRVQLQWEYDYLSENNELPPYRAGNVVKGSLTDQKRLWQKWAKFGISYFNKRKLLPTHNLIASYVEAIENDAPPPVTPEAGRITIDLLECIEKSLYTKQQVKMTLQSNVKLV